MEGTTAIPDKVRAIGKILDTATHDTPIRTPAGESLTPLAVLDADGERALPRLDSFPSIGGSYRFAHPICFED
jgi:hypothetical protein